MTLIDQNNTLSGEVKYPVCSLAVAKSVHMHSHQHGQHTEKRLFAEANKMLKRKLNRKNVSVFIIGAIYLYRGNEHFSHFAILR